MIRLLLLGENIHPNLEHKHSNRFVIISETTTQKNATLRKNFFKVCNSIQMASVTKPIKCSYLLNIHISYVKQELKRTNQFNSTSKNRLRNRTRKVIWFNPLFNEEVSTNIGKEFFTLV